MDFKKSEQIILEDIESVIRDTDLSVLKGKRVLLAGASGVVGNYLAHLFYALNQKGFGINVDLVMRNEVGSNSRVALIAESPGFRVIVKDLSKATKYEGGYDYWIHSAGYAAPATFLEDPVSTIGVNYVGIQSILEGAREHSPKATVLYLSSSEIYGSPTAENFPTPETYNGNTSVTNNRACYIESKRLAEVLCLYYKNKHNINVKIARPALSYGPGLRFDDGRVMSQFMEKARTKKVIDMLDDGRDLRCFCYMSDVLRQLVYILLFAKDDIYNVGSEEEEISIKQLADLIGSVMGARVVPGPGKTDAVVGAPTRVHLDMSKSKNEFGIKPNVNMEKGLRRMIDWNLAVLEES